LLDLASTLPAITLTRTDNGTTAAGGINFASTSTIRWQVGTNLAIGNGFEINQGNGAFNRFYINSSGNIGAGIATNLNARLTVNGGLSVGNGWGTSGATLEMSTDNVGSGGALVAVSYWGSSSYGPLVFATGNAQRVTITGTGIACFHCQVCTPYVSTNTINVGGSASNPTEACIGYGMFGYSGVGLAISAGATGGNQGIGFFVCNVERGRWITNGNLGIGTVCPSSRLTVNGNASIFGHLSTDRYYTTRGLVASTSGNWVNLYQLPTNYNYVLLIHVRQPETFYTYTTIAYVYNYYNGANNYAFVESYVKNGSTSLQISEGYIQARQSSGSNASMYWDLTIFGTLDTNF